MPRAELSLVRLLCTLVRPCPAASRCLSLLAEGTVRHRDPYTHGHPALPLPLAVPQSCPALTPLECAQPLERRAARTARPVEQPGSCRWAHAKEMHPGSVCTQTQRCRQHTDHALAHTWAGAGRGLVLARGWCWPLLVLTSGGTRVLGALLLQDGPGSQPWRALGALLGTLQAWQGSPGWLRWAALRLPAASPSPTKVLQSRDR